MFTIKTDNYFLTKADKRKFVNLLLLKFIFYIVVSGFFPSKHNRKINVKINPHDDILITRQTNLS